MIIIESNKNTYDLHGQFGIGYTFNNKQFYFDLEDYDKIKDYYWMVNQKDYVYTKMKINGKKRQIYMHRFVLGFICDSKVIVSHPLSNNFDNRKSQLKVITSKKLSKNNMQEVDYSGINLYNKLNINGYIAYYIPNHHLANKSGIVYEHEMIAEMILGRKLKKGEIVHHEDFNRANNDPQNLKVFKTLKDHAAFHKGMPIELDGDVYVAINYKRICPECGGKKDNKAILCQHCRTNLPHDKLITYYSNYPNTKSHKHKVPHPSKEELIEYLKQYNLTQIGKQFGVTSNAVKKWAVKYNIDYKSIKRNNKVIQ